MSVSSSPPGGLCAFEASCPQGWNINTASAWIQLDLGYLYYVTTINFSVVSGSFDNGTFEYKKHPDQAWKMLDVDMVIYILISNKYFSPHCSINYR